MVMSLAQNVRDQGSIPHRGTKISTIVKINFEEKLYCHVHSLLRSVILLAMVTHWAVIYMAHY